MNAIETLFHSSLIHCLGWTLVHFLWQGLAIGAIYVGMRRLLQGQSPAARYHLAMGALAVMAVLPIITFVHLAHATMAISTPAPLETLANVSTISLNQSAATAFSVLDHIRLWLQPLIPWAVPLWLLGVLAMTVRGWRGWRHAYQLRETAAFMSLPEWQALVESVRTLLGIKKLVRLAVSTGVAVPSVIGWLKPIILIPPSVIAGLTPLQMELILAHELAHIRRQDYLWNLLQIAVETLLFYHPVVRWVSHQARLEREQCCDDMVVDLHGNAVEYARALTELESLRQPRSALVMGANGGAVLDRIHRLLGIPASNTAASWVPLLLTAGLLFTASSMQFIHQKPAFQQAILTAKYTLLGNLASHTPAAKKTSAARLSPTGINAPVTHPAALKPARIHNKPPRIVFNAIPGLAAPVHPAVMAVDTAAPVVQSLSAPSHAGGTVIAQHSPVYPSIALERGVEGSATVEFTLTPEGGITAMHVIRVTGSRLFGQAAMDALRQWKIKPATLGGVPVAQRMLEEFVFRLHAPAANSRACKIPMGYHVCSAN